MPRCGCEYWLKCCAIGLSLELHHFSFLIPVQSHFLQHTFQFKCKLPLQLQNYSETRYCSSRILHKLFSNCSDLNVKVALRHARVISGLERLFRTKLPRWMTKKCKKGPGFGNKKKGNRSSLKRGTCSNKTWWSFSKWLSNTETGWRSKCMQFIWRKPWNERKLHNFSTVISVQNFTIIASYFPNFKEFNEDTMFMRGCIWWKTMRIWFHAIKTRRFV